MAYEQTSEVHNFSLVPQHEFTLHQPQDVRVGGKSIARMIIVVACLGGAAVLAFQSSMGIQNSEPHWLVISRSDTDDESKAEIVKEIGSRTTYLAKSWRLDPNQPLLVAPYLDIFVEGPDSVSHLMLPSVSAYTITSESTAGFASKISSKVGISGTYGAFTGAAEMSLTAMSSSREKQFRMEQGVRALREQISMKELCPHKVLTEDAKRILLKNSVDQIHANLGDFYVRQVGLGGIYQITVTMDMMKEDSEKSLSSQVTGEFDAVLSSAKASIEGGASISTNIGSRQAHTKVTVLGGDGQLWLGLTDENQAKIQHQWAKSVNVSNEYPIDVKLEPLWKLLDHGEMNRTKALELKSFMLDLWEQKASKVPLEHDPPPSAGATNAYFRVTGAGMKELNGYYGINPDQRKHRHNWRFQKMWHNGSFIVHYRGENKTFPQHQGELKLGLHHDSVQWLLWRNSFNFPYICGHGKKPDACQVVDEYGIPPAPRLEWLQKL